MMLRLLHLTPFFCLHRYDADGAAATRHGQRIDELDEANAITRARIHIHRRERDLGER